MNNMSYHLRAIHVSGRRGTHNKFSFVLCGFNKVYIMSRKVFCVRDSLGCYAKVAGRLAISSRLPELFSFWEPCNTVFFASCCCIVLHLT